MLSEEKRNPRPNDMTVGVRGAGELASGVIRRLATAGFRVVAFEKANPGCVRRNVCFAEAVYEKEWSVEGITGRLSNSWDESENMIENGVIPVMIDPEGEFLREASFDVIVDARMLKRNIDSSMGLASVVIGLGPGFAVGENCHAAVETNRGIDLGRVLYQGSPEADTGVPAAVEGKSVERVLRSPADGIFKAKMRIGDSVNNGDQIGAVSGIPVDASIKGVIRGLIRSGLLVHENQKIGDIDPRGIREHCFRISDKSNAVAAGVLEAILKLKKDFF